jgi:putative transcriptional regulator
MAAAKTGPKGPTPEQIRAAREAANLTQTEAATLCRSILRSWQSWEAGEYKMPPATFELFKLKTQGGFTIADVVREVAFLADEMRKTRVAKDPQVNEGLLTICQQAARFGAAEDAAEKEDAALWLREGYQLMSSGLPDTGHDEIGTGWGTAAIMARMLGTEIEWKKRVKNG